MDEEMLSVLFEEYAEEPPSEGMQIIDPTTIN